MIIKRISPHLTAVGIVVALSTGFGYAQGNQHDHATSPTAQNVSPERQAMMTNMRAEQKKLDELVAQMNAAKQSEKLDRMAAVVTEMAAMHKRMSSMMMEDGGMMQMMQMMHMEHGSMPAAPQTSPHNCAESH